MWNPSFRPRTLLVLFGGFLAVGLGIGALIVNISGKKAEEQELPWLMTPLHDDQVQPSVWGASFPAQLSGYRRMAEPGVATSYGGGMPYSKLIRNPALTRLWAGYPFAVDFNEERSHFYAQVDQMETKRNDQKWLHDHGFPDFKGQPGACLNCHSGWAPSLIREMGWEEFNKTPYSGLTARLREKHGEGMEGHALGSTCADCHTPDDMTLRVTRPAYINAMVARGYKKDPKTGLAGTHQEMRSHVCQQCHVEYYFAGPNKVLTFPWTEWPKDQPLTIEMIESYYDHQATLDPGFKKDWTHAESGAPMLKVQHPETELSSSGVHAANQVACADCHMPYEREGALKVTSHDIKSPLLRINSSCQTCHPGQADRVKERVELIQKKTSQGLREAEGAILALIDDIKAAQGRLEREDVKAKFPTHEEWATWVDRLLAPARHAHRRASLRWDFVASENSTGFHSPQEAQRILGAASQIARAGQLNLAVQLSKEGLPIFSTAGYGLRPQPGQPLEDRKSPVGDPPPQSLTDLDQKVSPTSLSP